MSMIDMVLTCLSVAAGEKSENEKLRARIAELEGILNTPTLEPFMAAAIKEAQHQRYRWGDEQDAKKTAWDWFWLLGYLGGKAAHAVLAGNWEKAQHHTITTAATLANWHRHITAAATAERHER